MIVIENVKPTARELRPVTRGWGGLHWWGCVTVLVPIFGLSAVVLTVAGMAYWYDELCEVVGIICLVTAVTWVVSRLLVNRLTLNAARAAPGGGILSSWRIDDEGLNFRTPVSTAHVDWRGIKGVRDERDRFVFLLNPHNNPVLPKRLLAEGQAEALRALVAEVTASGRLGRGVD